MAVAEEAQALREASVLQGEEEGWQAMLVWQGGGQQRILQQELHEYPLDQKLRLREVRQQHPS
eukprot:GAFH01001918.1.p6 GENE.GAFH01001918.1~~GAFH01001918.1.p6  ORF type:complete len:63 (+),score=7.30 GAFH01001918.1:1020-1208(+)